MKNIINISKDFTDTPWGRFSTDGNYSGERFREEFLLPALNNHEIVYVEIDGAEGYGSSFLDESFGGIIRKGYLSKNELKKKLVIVSNDPDFSIYNKLISRYIDNAKEGY